VAHLLQLIISFLLGLLPGSVRAVVDEERLVIIFRLADHRGDFRLLLTVLVEIFLDDTVAATLVIQVAQRRDVVILATIVVIDL